MTIRNRIQAASFAVLLSAVTAVSALAADRPDATIIKNPQCGCCESYADYLRQNGFKVTVKASHDLALMKREMGVPDDFSGCHTMVLDKYVVEGHVPVSAIDKLLAERPDFRACRRDRPGCQALSPRPLPSISSVKGRRKSSRSNDGRFEIEGFSAGCGGRRGDLPAGCRADFRDRKFCPGSRALPNSLRQLSWQKFGRAVRLADPPAEWPSAGSAA